MRRLLAGLGALLGAAVLTAPLATHAATYDPVAVSDPSHDDDPDEPARAGVDVVKVTGKRTATVFTVTMKVRDWQTVRASRRVAALIDPASGKGRLLEYRTTPSGTVQTALYKVVLSGGGERPEVTHVRCRGAAVTVLAPKDRIRFRLPAQCYPYRRRGSALLQSAAARWTAETWQRGSFVNATNEPEETDQVFAPWSWNGEPLPLQSQRRPDLF